MKDKNNSTNKNNTPSRRTALKKILGSAGVIISLPAAAYIWTEASKDDDNPQLSAKLLGDPTTTTSTTTEEPTTTTSTTTEEPTTTTEEPTTPAPTTPAPTTTTCNFVTTNSPTLPPRVPTTPAPSARSSSKG